jgi:hypothetical protein
MILYTFASSSVMGQVAKSHGSGNLFFFYRIYIRFAGILLRSCLSFVSRVYPFSSGVGFTYGGDLDYQFPHPIGLSFPIPFTALF